MLCCPIVTNTKRTRDQTQQQVLLLLLLLFKRSEKTRGVAAARLCGTRFRKLVGAARHDDMNGMDGVLECGCCD